ncbi:MAG: hypothetical protein V1758_11545, partial [Pseudomonadota bacterium]
CWVLWPVLFGTDDTDYTDVLLGSGIRVIRAIRAKKNLFRSSPLGFYVWVVRPDLRDIGRPD